MLRSLLRHLSRLAVPLPFALLAAGCMGDARGLGPEREAGVDGASRGADVAADTDPPPPELDTDPPPGDVLDDSEAALDVAMDTAVPPPDVVAPIGPAPVILGAAGKFAVLAKASITNVPTSAITGDLGISPAAATLITGFPLTRAGTKWTCPEVIGGVFAADNDPPTPADLTLAVANMETAYTDAAGRTSPAFRDLGAGEIGGFTFTPGLYRWSSTVTIVSDITIAGGPDDVWIFQITGDLAMSATKRMSLSGGARAKNIFWQVAGTVSLAGTAHAEGIVLCATAIKLATGASINGRLLGQTAIDIAGGTVTTPAP